MENGIKIKDLFIVVKGYIWLIISIVIAFTSASFIYGHYIKTPLYQSSTRLIIPVGPDLLSTAEVIIKDSTILDKVSEQLRLNRSSEALSGQINVSGEGDSKIVSITVIDTNPRFAVEIANTTADVFTKEISSIMGINNAKVLSAAKNKIYPIPINSTSTRDLMVAFIIGLLLGIGLALFLNSLDTTIKSEHHLESLLDLPVLGGISKMSKKNIMKKQNGVKNVPREGEPFGYL